jgi:hypothetical protein
MASQVVLSSIELVSQNGIGTLRSMLDARQHSQIKPFCTEFESLMLQWITRETGTENGNWFGFCDDGDEPWSYIKAYNVMISEINTIWSRMKLFQWPLSTVIYFTFSIHCRLSLDLKSQGWKQKHVARQQSRSLSLTQTRVNDTWDARFSQHHCLLRCDKCLANSVSE